jgi:hypothetical protein
MKGLCPYRAIASFPISQGVALGWRLIAPSGRYRKDADNHFVLCRKDTSISGNNLLHRMLFHKLFLDFFSE